MAFKRKEKKVQVTDNLGDFPKKWAKVIQDDMDFISKAQQSSYDDLKQMIVDYSANIAEFEKDQEADLDLKSAKETYDTAKSVYTDGIKVNQAKARYCSYIIKSLGKPAKKED
jgi:hypothetical protein